MGSLLLASGASGMRYSLPNSKIMMHQPSGGFQVSVIDLIIMSPVLKGRVDILLLVRILSALLIVCTLSPEPVGGF